ncbi:hypothetical protein F5Y16DRAFT_388746 [Xylariaceae sp. FL0255]|nr:hypothetical protein F5Y16DRAFT_388746 [Xylariaceae sp. FL0255]
MLERAAATLEPCGLRILPARRSKPFRSNRALHTTFWQHGAAGLELSSAWLSLMHGTSDSDHSRQSPINASAFLLDFLYPSGAVALMRRLALSSSSNRPHDPFRPPPRQRNTPLRFYNSTTPRHQSQNPDHPEPAEHSVEIERILREEHLPNSDLLWHHFNALDPETQHPYFCPVLLFLSKTGRVADSWKISELFHKLDPVSWDNSVFIAGVIAEVNLQNLSSALDIFKRGLSMPGIFDDRLIEALDLLLSTALQSTNDELLSNLWSLFPEMSARWAFDDNVNKLKRVAAVPGLVDRTFSLEEIRTVKFQDASTTEAERAALNALQKILVRVALLKCADDQVMPLLLTTRDPLAFEDYIQHVRDLPKTKLTVEAYLIYRDLPQALPSTAVLHCTFEAYLQRPPHQRVRGVELIWSDWSRFYGSPSRKAYQRYLAFHGAQGDRQRTYKVWMDYTKYWSDRSGSRPVQERPGLSTVMETHDTFSFLMQAHAVNGEPEEALRIFNYMVEKHKVIPNNYNWNILLNAYVTANDYDGAIEVFRNLSSVIEPDGYSYATLMHLTGSRGDLGLTVDLYRLARDSGIVPNQAMLIALIDAYCQNDHFKEAEDVCIRAANKGFTHPWIWNRVLYYYALRRDLGSLNKLLNVMADKNIPYNSFTYEQLLLGLCMCRQARHALNLLITAVKDEVFEIRATHFQIVMAALLRTGEPQVVIKLSTVMRHYGFHVNQGTLFRLGQAFSNFHLLPPRQRMTRTKKTWLADALRTFYDIYGIGREQVQVDKVNTTDTSSTEETFPTKETSSTEQTPPTDQTPATDQTPPTDQTPATDQTPPTEQTPFTKRPSKQTRVLLRGGPDAYQFGTMTQIFAQLSDRVMVDEVLDLYRYVFRGTDRDDSVLPLPLLTSIMLINFREGKYHRVRETWNLLFTLARKEGQSMDYDPESPSRTSKISAKYRYSLNPSITVMMDMFFEETNPSGLERFVNDVLAAGFELDGKNWNFYVQRLVQLKQFKSAFNLCEKIMMPHWMGWSVLRSQAPIKNALPLEMRRLGRDKRNNRPIARTLYYLAQGYLTMQKESLYSSTTSLNLKLIEQKCVQVLRAIKTMVRVHSQMEMDIFANDEMVKFDRIDESTGVAPEVAPGETINLPVDKKRAGHPAVKKGDRFFTLS